MGFVAADELLRLPVRLHGIQLGRPVDVLLDAEAWRVVGLDVLCGDEVHRFLPLGRGRACRRTRSASARRCCCSTTPSSRSTATGPDSARAARDAVEGAAQPARACSATSSSSRRRRRSAGCSSSATARERWVGADGLQRRRAPSSRLKNRAFRDRLASAVDRAPDRRVAGSGLGAPRPPRAAQAGELGPAREVLRRRRERLRRQPRASTRCCSTAPASTTWLAAIGSFLVAATNNYV